MLSRRPPDRRPLPTARFLDVEHRTLLRLQHRPADVPLLLVRMLFALMLGAAFAGISWSPERSGTSRFLLVDVAGVSTDGVDAMQTAVAAALADAATDEVAVEVVAYARDAEGSLLTSSRPEELVTSTALARTDALAGLRALSMAAFDAVSLDSAEVTWILRPDWAQWTKGVGLLREAFWGGAIELRTSWPESPGPGRLATSDVQAASLGTGFGPDAPLERALSALGVPLGTGSDVETRWAFADGPAAEAMEGLIEQARSGQTVVISGALPDEFVTSETEFPWDASIGSAVASTQGRVVLSAGNTAGEGVPRDQGEPRPGSSVIALFDDLHPAAAARRVGDGCVVYSAASLAAPSLAATSGYVELVSDLMFGCADDGTDSLPLDRGALSALSRNDLPTRVSLADVLERQASGSGRGIPGPGRSLTPLFLLMALGMVGLEVWLTRVRPS
jgi:hypothetical protein